MVFLLLLSHVPTDSPAHYFPARTIDTYPRSDDYIVRCYSDELVKLHEPSLFESAKDNQNETYRFTYLRAFNEPIAIRMVVQPDGLASLHVKRAPRKNGKKILPAVDQTITLSKEEVDSVLARVSQSNFWTLSPQREQAGLDGSAWIVEGVKDGKYHLIVRWSPRKGDFRKIGLLFLKKSKLNLSDEEIY